MLDILRTTIQKTDNPNIYVVHWLLNDKRHGRVRVELKKKETKDLAIRAELAAIHHLIVNKQICGKNRFGDGMRLIVFSGAIKKIVSGRSSKTRLDDWCTTLQLRLRDAEIVVSNNTTWIDRYTLESTESIQAIKPPIEEFNLHGLGKVRLSEHALERFTERNQNKTYKNALSTMISMLADPAVIEVTLPDNRRLKQLLRHMHPHLKNTRYFYNPRTNWQFVVAISHNKMPTVVTAYTHKHGMTRFIRLNPVLPTQHTQTQLSLTV